MPSAADPASSDPRFSIGPRGTSPGGLSERARVSQPFSTLWRVRGRRGRQPASIMSTRAEATGPFVRGEELQIFWVGCGSPRI